MSFFPLHQMETLFEAAPVAALLPNSAYPHPEMLFMIMNDGSFNQQIVPRGTIFTSPAISAAPAQTRLLLLIPLLSMSPRRSEERSHP
jgi:hypothetical protein